MMKSIKRRVSKLEKKNDPDRITGFNIVIVDCKDHVENPNMYNKILESEDTSETGFTTKIYRLEPKG